MELTTCLWFNRNAREAANFYTSIFPDSSIQDNWIAPIDTPGNKQGEEIVVNFKIFGQKFIGLMADLNFRIRRQSRFRFLVEVNLKSINIGNY